MVMIVAVMVVAVMMTSVNQVKTGRDLIRLV